MELPDNTFEIIDSIFHSGALRGQAVRTFFILFYSMLAKMPRKLLEIRQIKHIRLCNIPWLSMHGLLQDLPGTVEIVLSCLSSVQ
jgi:hypothetical protein